MEDEKPNTVPEAARLGMNPKYLLKFDNPFPTSAMLSATASQVAIAIFLVFMDSPWEWDGGFVYSQRKILIFILCLSVSHDVVVLLRRFLSARKTAREKNLRLAD